MDQLYFEDGYYEGKYFVYTASALVGFTPYIDAGYLDSDFFEDRGSAFSVVCEGTRLRIITAEASMAAAFAQTTTGNTDARTTVTLSTIANVSAQALKLRQLSSSLSAVATHTVQSTITASANLALTSAFAPTITANASVSNGSDLVSTFAFTALTGVRRQFPLNQLTGLGATSNQYGVIDFNESLFPPPVSGNLFTVRGNGWTFGSWVKRDTITGEYQCIAEGTVIEESGSGSNNNGGITLKNDDVRIRFNYDPDEPGATWNNVAPTDTEWHHYLFRTVSANYWQLWIDGVNQGLSSGYFAASDLQFAGRYGSGEGTLYGGLRLGYGLIAADTGGYGISGSPLMGGVAQVWMGNTTNDQFRVERFYSGLLDLGTAGTSTGLPTPVFYNKLTLPYTGVTWNSSTPSVPYPASQPLGLPSAEGKFTLTAVPQNVLVVTGELVSTSTVTATAFKIVTSITNLTSTATVTGTINRLRVASASLTSSFTQNTAESRFRGFVSSLGTNTTLTCDTVRVQPAAATLSASTTQTATGFRIKPLAASVVSQFTVTAQIDDRNRDAIALQMGAFTLAGSISRTRNLSTSITAISTFNIEYEVIRPAGSAMSASFTQTADPSKVIVSFGNFTARFTQQVTAFRVAIASATLQVNGFTLTQGDILNFDPCREIRVDQETRLAKILPENRLVIVESETRMLRVPQETRVLKVDYETRVNTIKC